MVRARRMLVNVVDNAVKYAALHGRIDIVLRGRSEESGYEIIISDDGPGIAADDIAVALELFGRVGGVDDPFAEPGIGLTIAANIAAAHEGRLSINSVPGHGTNVVIALPAEPAASVAALQERVAAQSGTGLMNGNQSTSAA
ncbi:MAG: ATP-binding protein [Pseudomonadota bacterium]